MAYTDNYGLKKAEQSDYVSAFIEDYNENLEKIDDLPLPVQSGSNTNLTYQKFADGTLHVWGMIDYGKQYPCYRPWASSAGWASDDMTISLPTAFSSPNYSLVVHVTADVNPDMWFVTQNQGTSSITGCFLCAIDDHNSGAGINSKKLNIDAWGRWK